MLADVYGDQAGSQYSSTGNTRNLYSDVKALVDDPPAICHMKPNVLLALETTALTWSFHVNVSLIVIPRYLKIEVTLSGTTCRMYCVTIIFHN